MKPKHLMHPHPGFVLALIILTYAYAWGLHSIPLYHDSLWQSIALLNTGLALISLFLWKPRMPPTSAVSEQVTAWAIGPFLLAMTLLVIVVSNQFEDVRPTVRTYSLIEILGLCVWIPIIEEIIFRRFLANWIGLKLDGLWGIYVSGLIFALAHTAPPGNLWPPLGPFLLGCATTWAYRVSGRIGAPVLLHAACNASAILFAIYAPSWLEILSGLYQNL
ncbi:MAG: CPBP family intramembrane metalloprotease [Proteobacteria bacterium]|nr:MAG: CPBP family intramembrane metalloprotease [Pseudomonadota bacterium]